MRTFLKITLVLSVVLAAAAPSTACVLEEFFAREVLIITPHAPEQVALNRQLWVEGDPVPDVYGVPTNEPVRVLFPDPAKLVRPAESKTGLTLLAVDKQAGENPLQVRSVWFIAWRAATGFGLSALLALGLLAWTGRRR
jgi:hypothetical protein